MADAEKTDEPVAASEDRTITLSKEVKFGDETIKTLEYRAPTGEDILRCGHPLKFNWSMDPPEITFDEKKMAAMMAALYRQPPSVISRLSPQDWTTAAVKIMVFFTPDLRQI